MDSRKVRLTGLLTLLPLLAVSHGGAKARPLTKPESVAATMTVMPPTPAATVSPTLTKTDFDAWLDGYMPYALHTGDIPGTVVVVVKDGRILTARGFGYADLDKRTPIDPERTLFRPGSVSKLLTWTAVMQLVEQGKLDLDTDVNAYLDFKIAPRAGRPITLRHIMTHTAGFEEAVKDIIFYDARHSRPLGALIKTWVPERIFPAGTTPAYSNYATALAGYIVERVSGMRFEDYVDQHIFAPLGMHNSTFRQPLPGGLAAQMATGYSKPGQVSQGFEFIGPGPAGALSSSGTDMGRFMIAHLQQGELDGQRILSVATATMMHDSPLSSVDPLSLIPPLNRMELGFFETNINGHTVIGHLGDTEQFHTSLHLFMKDNVGLYVSFSGAGKAGAAGTLRSALFQDFADRYFPDTGLADGKVDAKVAADHARMMTGVWQNSRGSVSNFFSLLGLLGQTKVGLTDKGELLVPALVGPNGRPRDWVEIAPFVWRDRNGHDRLAARVANGQVTRWSMDFMSPFMVFDRVPEGLSSAWIMPALYVSMAILVCTLLSWPIGWWVRRRYGVTLALTGGARTAYRATRMACALTLAILAGWGAALAAVLNNLKYATDAFDPWFMLLQILGLIVFSGTVLVSLWNLRLTWSDGRKWPRKLWSALIFAAALVVLYVALRFGMISMKTHY